MLWHILVVFSAVLGLSAAEEDWKFPPGFRFGAASAAYQVEGAWNISDKGENIWDRFTHSNPDAIKNQDNGDVACDSYHLLKRDIEMAAELGLHYYRISLSWSRLLPTGFTNRISEDGTRYYNELINGLLEKGIEPMVTLYHWDLPQPLQDLGGWTNPNIADWFADYARVVFSLYGDRVKKWLTLNEPIILCDVAYNSGILAPGIVSVDHGTFMCNKNILVSHAKAYRVYEKNSRISTMVSEISIANHLFWYEPWTEDDVELADLAVQNCAGRYSHAIYSKKGGWPPAIEEAMAVSSKKKGYSTSILPAFTKDEIELVKGTFDFYAFNYYTSKIVRPAKEGEEMLPFGSGDIPDLNAIVRNRPEWPVALSDFAIFPEGLRRQLVWLKKNYGDLNFVITETGYPTLGGLEDSDRIDFYQKHLQQLLLAINEDEVNVTHFTAWSLLDNFEWIQGYSLKFGLYEVNFTDPMRTRTARDSARYYTELINNNQLPDTY